MFDVIIINFDADQQNLQNLQQRFPHARTVPFVDSYFNVLRSCISSTTTQFVWLISDLVYCNDFDFDYIPPKHEHNQIHVWNVDKQSEGDLMLIPRQAFQDQMFNIKFLRDYQDVNYKYSNSIAVHQWPQVQFDFNNLNTQVKQQTQRYTEYYLESPQNILPSFWEDQKLYVYDVNRYNMLVPKFELKQELYEHKPIFFMEHISEPQAFDVVFIDNGEPQAEENFQHLKLCLENKPNCLHRVSGVKGRTQAYKTAANASNTDYFYAVFAKLETNVFFGFNFVPDLLKSPRHYIFDCYNPVIDYAYGHQAVILYNKQMVLDNPGTGLDFTLAQQHDHVAQLSASTTFNQDPQVCYRTAFREVVKLHYFQHTEPTIETAFVIRKWAKPNDQIPGSEYALAAYQDAVEFVESNNYNFDKIFESYEWDLVDSLFAKRFS